MGTLAEAVLSALKGFATEVGTWTNQGTLVSIEGHIAQIEHAVVQDVHAGETAAKAVLADLYGAFHGTAPVADDTAPEPTEAPAPESTTPATGGTVTDAPVIVGESGPETLVPPAAADPTPAPSTTEDSSAPSSTPSDSTTDAAPTGPEGQ